MNEDRINVTQTFLPPLQEYEHYLRKIWGTAHITNNGPLLKEFEKSTEKFLNVSKLQFVANGTLALQLSLDALGITNGEIITTPFSYVATTAAILWQRCKPVYVDIDPSTLNIDPSKIEAAITAETKAILAVHVFGNPCEVEEIERIAKKHSLKVIYDAAHAFAVTYRNKSLLAYGDVSTCSFHATKLFHSIEGGAVVSQDQAFHKNFDLAKRFGHNGDEHFMLGINAKASEFQAAMGLCNLKYVTENIEKRRYIYELYDGLLKDSLERQVLHRDAVYNYAYYPVLLKDEATALAVINALKNVNIFPRRYFHPSLNKLPYVTSHQECPISENIASRIICLPLYAGLEQKYVYKIAEVLNAKTT